MPLLTAAGLRINLHQICPPSVEKEEVPRWSMELREEDLVPARAAGLEAPDADHGAGKRE